MTQASTLTSIYVIGLATRDNGFTLDEDFRSKSFTNGYMVALNKNVETSIVEMNDVKKIAEMLTDLSSQVGGDVYIGGWVDEGKLCLELAQFVRNREEAIRLGHEREQRAIYDILRDVDLYMKDHLPVLSVYDIL